MFLHASDAMYTFNWMKNLIFNNYLKVGTHVDYIFFKINNIAFKKEKKLPCLTYEVAVSAILMFTLM